MEDSTLSELESLRIELAEAKEEIRRLEDLIEKVTIHLAMPFKFPGIRFEVDPDGTDTRYHRERTPPSKDPGFAR